MVSSSSSGGGAPDPWGCVAIGKTDDQGETTKTYLQTQFTATSSGGLKCNTCCFSMCRVDLISKTPKGVTGILTNHLSSNEHKAAVRGQQNKAATQGLHAYFARKPAAPSQGGVGERAAAVSLPARTAGASLPTPFVPQPDDVLSTSEDEEDEAVAAEASASLIENFRSLSTRSKISFAQQMTKVMKRCKGFRPPSLDGVLDLLNHVPAAVRVLVADGLHGLEGLPVERHASVAQAGTVEVLLGKQKDTKIVRCEPCQRGNKLSEMVRADLRLHAAGHLFLPSHSSPTSLCGFCGLELAQTRCSVEVKDGKLLSTCSFKLPRLKYSLYAQQRESELKRRLELDGEPARATATKAGLGLGASKAGKASVRNIPIPCPMPDCSSVIWKLNLIPHLLEGDHPLPSSCRSQRLRKRWRPVLKELQVLVTSSQRDKNTYALRESVLQEVEQKLEEVRDLLDMAGKDLGATVSFCLEEVVRESQPALAKYNATRKAYQPRGERKDKGKKKGKDGAGGESAAGGEEGGGDDDGSGGAAVALGEGSEDEEEGEGEGERGAAGGQSNGKRPADGEGVDSASKGKKPKKLT